ncbi:MAG: UDP-N-acetylmuramoyl-L-alanyl-D-glutamate--2,6-diaminopimelate ligase [Lachnospiraceae bacterium]|nr:UDP-N-acetylmuramoyl-L-alanyl-D-glutamate--2,6-diaminopimelate ligase [Lachnospiraceae bacterium]
MKLSSLIKDFEYSVVTGSVDAEVTDFTNDSRKVVKGSAFICIKGAVSDGHAYAEDVIKSGASAVIVQDDLKIEIPKGVTVVKTKDTRYAMALMSAAFFGYPADKLKVIGITGTKGKTTTTYMIREVLERSGFKTGLIGTIETIIGDKHIPSANTTPESFVIQKTFKDMVESGITHVVMEVSSQGLMLHRTAGINFEIGVFTNLEPDHIGPNEHESFEDYMHCKGLLFKQCRLGLINADDEHANSVIEGHTCELKTFGLKDSYDYHAKGHKLITGPGYIGVGYTLMGKESFDIEIKLPGTFSIYNSLCAASVALELGAKPSDVKNSLSEVKVKGRTEIIKISDDFTLMIDYAHNAMALESLLNTLKEYKPGRIVTLFGCGGNRAKSRRFEMGEVSGKLSDLTVITSDNPRNEKPEDIIADIVTGIKKTTGEYVCIPDRKEAIKYVIENAKKGDCIILAGKGHEDYQEINGAKHHMDERELIEEVLKELKQ